MVTWPSAGYCRPCSSLNAGSVAVSVAFCVGHAGVEHRHGDRRSGLRLNVPRLLDVDQRQVPLQRQSRADRWAPSVAWTRCATCAYCTSGRRRSTLRGLFRVFGRIDADDVEVGVRGTGGDLAGVAGRAHRGAAIRHRRLVAEPHDDAARPVAQCPTRRCDRTRSVCAKRGALAASRGDDGVWLSSCEHALVDRRQADDSQDLEPRRCRRPGRAASTRVRRRSPWSRTRSEHEIDPSVYSIG